MRVQRWWFSLFGLLVMLSWARPVQAEDINQAVQLYKKAYAQLKLANYRKALVLFTQARENLPKERRYRKTFVAFQYFIGLCHFHLNNKRQARRLLKMYLESKYKKPQKARKAKRFLYLMNNPPAIRRATPRRRVVVRRSPPVRRVDPPVRSAPPIRRPATPPVKKNGGGVHPGAVVITVVGVAAVAGGVVAGVLAQGKVDEAQANYRKLSTSLSAQASNVSGPYREGESFALIANSLYIGGGVVTGVGILLLATWRTAPAKK